MHERKDPPLAMKHEIDWQGVPSDVYRTVGELVRQEGTAASVHRCLDY